MEQGKKISELERIPSLNGDEIIPIVHEGRNYKMSVNDIVEFSGGKSSGALPKDIPVGNTDLGDALLSVADNSEIVRLQYLDKSAKKLKAGTPYDLLFSALLYTDREANQPSVVVTQGAITYNGTKGKVSIGSIGAPKIGDVVEFNVTYSPASVTKSNSSIKITNGYGYATSSALTDTVGGSSVTITKEATLTATQNASLTVKHNGNTLTHTSKNGNVYKYSYTAVEGSNTITAFATEAKYNGHIDGIHIWPYDEFGALAKDYPQGAKTNAVDVTNLVGGNTDEASSSVTAILPAYIYYYNGENYNDTPVELEYNYGGNMENALSTKDKGVYIENITEEMPFYIVVPTKYSESNVKIHMWYPTLRTFKEVKLTITIDDTYDVDRTKYKVFKCEDGSMGDGTYYITIV